MPICSYSRDKLQNHEFGGAAYVQPSAWFVKLHLGDPGVNCTANPAATTTRAAVTFSGSSAGSDPSASAASWTSVSTSETYAWVSLWDNATGGNPLRYGQLTTPVAVTAGASFTI